MVNPLERCERLCGNTEVAAAIVNPAGASRLLGVGGGSGPCTLAFLHAQPSTRATRLDKPEGIEMAGARAAAAGMADRVTLVPGDFYTDGLPKAHDLALSSAIIHQNSPVEYEESYRKIHCTLHAGVRIVIREDVMSPDHTQPWKEPCSR